MRVILSIPWQVLFMAAKQPTVSHTESSVTGYGLGRFPEAETYAFSS